MSCKLSTGVRLGAVVTPFAGSPPLERHNSNIDPSVVELLLAHWLRLHNLIYLISSNRPDCSFSGTGKDGQDNRNSHETFESIYSGPWWQAAL